MEVSFNIEPTKEAQWIKLNGSLTEHIETLEQRGKVKHLIIHDVVSCKRFWSDQGYEPEMTPRFDHAIRLQCTHLTN